MPPTGACYCIISNNEVVDQVDVYKDGQKVHYKKYDNVGRVIENAMYSPDGNGGWHIIDDIGITNTILGQDSEAKRS